MAESSGENSSGEGEEDVGQAGAARGAPDMISGSILSCQIHRSQLQLQASVKLPVLYTA